jgi:hypothetical protein
MRRIKDNNNFAIHLIMDTLKRKRKSERGHIEKEGN